MVLFDAEHDSERSCHNQYYYLARRLRRRDTWHAPVHLDVRVDGDALGDAMYRWSDSNQRSTRRTA